MDDLKVLFIMLGLIALASLVLIAGFTIAVCIYRIIRNSYRNIALILLCGIFIFGVFRFLGTRE